jgi:hypothetical protein
MKIDPFLKCLSSTGIDTGISILGVYAFDSGSSLSGTPFVYNQLYSTETHNYSGVLRRDVLPLIYAAAGTTQPSGNFNGSRFYQTSDSFSGNFSMLLALDYSGCIQTFNSTSRVLLATSKTNSSSGFYLGITPSSRLFVKAGAEYNMIPREIGVGDFAFISIADKRFVNFGLFSLEDNAFYNKQYDAGSGVFDSRGIFIGGASTYPTDFGGYSGLMREAYFFSGVLPKESVGKCVDCSFVSGYSNVVKSGVFNQTTITGSIWSGVSGASTTGYSYAKIPIVKSDGLTGYVAYDSGLSGNTLLYQKLVPIVQQSTGVSYYTGFSFLYDNSFRSNVLRDIFFDGGLSSGDIVEIYSYPAPTNDYGNPIQNSMWPKANSGTAIQLFGNGLAETSGDDFSVMFNGLISGFDSDDYLQYDIVSSGTVTLPYTSAYIQTGLSTSGYVWRISGASGLSFAPPLLYDVYFDGQKLMSGFDYVHTATNPVRIFSSVPNGIWNDAFYGINENPPQEIKFVPYRSDTIRTTGQITSNVNFFSGVSGFPEQVWVNGIRQKNGIDYFTYPRCRFCSGEYNEPDNFTFKLFSDETSDSPGSFINTFSSFAEAVSAQIDLRIAGLTSSAKSMYSTADVVNAVYVRSTGFWAKDVKNITAISPSQHTNGTNYTSQIGATLVSPRHIIGCSHGGAGLTRRFVTNDNVVIERDVVASIDLPTTFPYYPDIKILLLDSDVPPEIGFMKVLPRDWRKVFHKRGLTPLSKIPIFGCDQQNKAVVFDWNVLEIYNPNLVRLSCGGVPSDAQRAIFSEVMVAGDSGHPVCMIIDGEAVLMSAWTYGEGNEAGPEHPYFYDEINAAMNSLGGGYQLTEYDLSKYY